MGGVVSHCPDSLCEDAQPQASNSLKEIQKAIKLFSKKASKRTSFGFGIEKKLLVRVLKFQPKRVAESLFRVFEDWSFQNDGTILRTKNITLSKPDLKTMPSIRRSHTKLSVDEPSTINALEVLCGLILVSVGKFEAKLRALYSLFDFNEDKGLQKDEFVMLLRCCLASLAKLTSTPEILPSRLVMQKFAKEQFERADASVTKDSVVSIQEFTTFVLTEPIATKFICQFGTTDAHKAFSRARTLSKKPDSKRKGLSRVKTSTSKPSMSRATTFLPPNTDLKNKRDLIRYLKKLGMNTKKVFAMRDLFEKLDINVDGDISVKELQESMESEELKSVCSSLLRINGGHARLTFERFLGTMFQKLNPQTIRLVAKAFETDRPQANHMLRASLIFDMLDAKQGFQGTMEFKVYIDELHEAKEIDSIINLPQVKRHLEKTCKSLRKPINKEQGLEIIFCKVLSKAEIKTYINKIQSRSALNSTKLGEVEMQSLKNAFYDIDTSHDGAISEEEFIAYMESIGVYKEDAEQLFKDGDIHKDSMMHFSEFVVLYASTMRRLYKTERGYSANSSFDLNRTLADKFVEPRDQTPL